MKSGVMLRLSGTSDVLAQHQRKCETTLQSQETVRPKESGKQMRTRRACDQCAQSKAKCDSKEPCGRCRSRSFACSHTRKAPHRIVLYAPQQRDGSAVSGSGARSSTPGSPLTQSRDGEVRDFFVVSPTNVDIRAGGSSNADMHQGELLQQHEALVTASGRRDELYNSSLLVDQRQMFDFGIGPMSEDLDFGPIFDTCSDLDSLPFYSDRNGTYEPLQSSLPQSILGQGKLISHHSLLTHKLISRIGAAISTLQPVPQPLQWTGFSVDQIDPVEASCQGLRNLLKASEPLVVTDEMISASITRENVLLCCRAYGEMFQRNYPIIHMPSFKLTETPPLLLLAVILGGACGSDGQPLSSAYITKFAMQTLILVQNQSVSPIADSSLSSLTRSSMRQTWAYRLCPRLKPV